MDDIRNTSCGIASAIVARLVGGAVFNTPVILPDKVDWPSVILAASDQGLTAVSYGGVKLLDTSKTPGFQDLLRWDVSSQIVRENFCRKRAAKEHLRDFYADSGIRMLILKGETLADNYPRPEERESGDLDIMLFEDFENGNRMAEAAGIKVDYGNSKHTNFFFEGVEIENHDPAPHPSYDRCDYQTEVITAEHLCDAVKREDGCWELPPIISGLYNVNHIAHHLYLNDRIPMKMMLDLALLIRRHPEIESGWGPYLEKCGLADFASALLSGIGFLFEGSGVGAYAARGSGSPLAAKGEALARDFVLCECPRRLRILRKYRYLPRTVGELAREMYVKVTRVAGARLFGRFRKG